MKKLNSNILNLFKSSIKLDEIIINDIESGKTGYTGDYLYSKILGKVFPYISIGGIVLSPEDILDVRISCTGFIPTISLNFRDTSRVLSETYFPVDGEVISVYLRSSGDEVTFNPIRLDFSTNSIIPLNFSYVRNFKVDGVLRIPQLWNDITDWKESSSIKTFIKIAKDLQLGFSSNIEETNDSQTWICAKKNRYDWIKDITKRVYFSDESFFDSWIDFYYNLNLVEMNRLFNHDEDIEQSKLISTGLGDIIQGGETSKFNFPSVITNLHQLRGTNRFFSNYSPFNNSANITEERGYYRYAKYWDYSNKEYVENFIDPLTSENSASLIKTKGRYIGPLDNRKIEFDFEQRPKKYEWVGYQSDNSHPNYCFSKVLNEQNLIDTRKVGMKINMSYINDSIYKGQRIFVAIYNYGNNALNLANPSFSQNGKLTDLGKTYTAQRNEDALLGSDFVVYNQGLSGFYIVVGFDITWNPTAGFQHIVSLIRREINTSA